MGSIFYNRNFNEDITGWDTSKCTSMTNMFYLATAFNQDVSIWDTSKVCARASERRSVLRRRKRAAERASGARAKKARASAAEAGSLSARDEGVSVDGGSGLLSERAERTQIPSAAEAGC
jgi:hypothetical protein